MLLGRSRGFLVRRKTKPRWMICVVFTAGLLIMTLSAVASGIFIGYTYCYVEHRTDFRAAGNISQIQDLRIFNVPLGDAQKMREQNTINGALVSSQLVQKFLKIGHTLWDDDHAYLLGHLMTNASRN
ncbi:uncharacterized protein LOC123872475 isoform X2 [Maniola jurtina]|uniref:uncharacterized protein LOC123872475 isoform X2 n=1 Tax=Maniola jurtina TaxID=191418 RepID=UPI001E687916|nr:uncharacterized protein LOC123872475 isoform X2 [Maniola jurtina]